MTFSRRLKEERKRLKYNQVNLSESTGIARKSQVSYENDALPPFAGYLEKLSDLGFDVQYLLTGVRSGTALAPEEKYLLALYREAPPALKKAAVAALASGGYSGGIAIGPAITVGGDNNGNIATGDVVAGNIGGRSRKK
jgi:transcriptional regulator with XRE-family HTH domain